MGPPHVPGSTAGNDGPDRTLAGPDRGRRRLLDQLDRRDAGKRATPDVSLDADPASSISVYDSTRCNGGAGWWGVDGTSAPSPIWAARSADAGLVVNASYVYGSSITFRDITSGNNGAPCLVGFDLCSGHGSWTGATP